MTHIEVAVLVGSNRTGSLNRRLAAALMRLGPSSFVFEEIGIDDMPFYNADLEASRPETVRAFTDQIRSSQALLIVTPEYNRSIPAVLKNAIDWGSKPTTENVWRDMPAAIAGASPGAIGTAVGQQHLRQILAVLGATVMGGEAYISFKRPDLIDEDGHIDDESTRDFLKAYMDKFASLAQRLLRK